MTLSFHIEHAFQDFRLHASMDAADGVTALFGRSGAGKTSVANILAGVVTPDRGKITIAGQDVLDTSKRVNRPVHKRGIGYVFQDARLFPHLSVKANLDYGRKARGLNFDQNAFGRTLSLLGISDLLDRQPETLSGGEKQRVAIGRALLSQPKLLILDEPLAALDDARKQDILPYLERLRDEARIPVVYISHSVSEVARIADRVAIMSDGKIVKTGSVQEIFADPSVAMTIGASSAGSVLTAAVKTHHADGLTELDLAGTALFLPRLQSRVGATVRVRIRAQDIMLSLNQPAEVSALNILPTEISAVQTGAGPGVMVQLKHASGLLLARVTQRSASALRLQQGMKVFAVVKTVSVAHADVGGPISNR